LHNKRGKDSCNEFEKTGLDTDAEKSRRALPGNEANQAQFATNALSCSESPLWIANVMGHRDTNMIIKVYSKYIKDANGSVDGLKFDNLYSGIIEKQK
jgi:hypothetical protein